MQSVTMPRLAGMLLAIGLCVPFAELAVVEARIDVIADFPATVIYVKAVPGKDLRYRLKPDGPFVAATSTNGYVWALEVPAGVVPAQGKLPIEIAYRGWVPFERRTWVALDVDREQVRHFITNLGSRGWASVAQFEGRESENLRLFAPNERCIRWRYGIDEGRRTYWPEGQSSIAVPASARSVSVQPVFCKGAEVCTVTVTRGATPAARTDCDS